MANPKHPPFIHVRLKENRTPTGRRTSTPARKAALYYSFGRDKAAELEGQQRGQWLGPGGKVHSHDEVMKWIRTNAPGNRFTFQGLLSVPEGKLDGADFARALAKGQRGDWRLIAHHDTRHAHAHVLWFGDKRLEKKEYLAWQEKVRAELTRLEAKQMTATARQEVKQDYVIEDAPSSAGRARSVGQEVGPSWM